MISSIAASPRPPAAAPKPTAAPMVPGPTPGYSYDVTIDAAKRTLQGSGSIEVTNNQAEPLNEVYLRVWPNSPQHAAAGGSATVADITVDGKPAPNAKLDRTVVHVPFDSPLTNGQSATIGFDLGVTATKGPDRFGVDKAGTVLFGNALPTVAVRDDEGWNLDPYVPFGESFYTLAGDWNARLRSATDVQVASTGVATSEQVENGTRVTSIDAPHVRDFFLAAGKGLQVKEDTVDGTKVRVFTSKQDAGNAADMLTTATESVKYFNREIGKYDSPELDVVAATEFVAGGMEYPGAIIVNGSASKAGRDHIVAHENAHQWFYSMVGNNQYDDPWLDESLTEHAAQRFIASGVHGTPPAAKPGEHVDTSHAVPAPAPPAAAKPANISAPTHEQAPGATDFNGARPLIRNIYGEGPRVLGQLRSEIGDARFDTGMKKYFADNRNGVGSTAGFIDTMSTAAGRDLSAWFGEHRIVANEPGAAKKLDPNGPPT